MGNSWMGTDIRHEIFESFCYMIGAYASLCHVHACFCIRSIEGIRLRSMIKVEI